MPDLPERVPAERRAALLASLARSIAASLDLDTILQTVAEGARELCRSDLSAIALREPDTGDMVFRVRAGVRLHSGDRLTVEMGRGAGGRVLDTGKPFRSDDLSQEPAFADDAGYREIVNTERIVTVMVVPITIDERIEGLLYVDNRTVRPFTDHDEAILTELADHAAIAIRNVRLLAREQRAREEAEAANRMKDEFLATLSHELRTPLNAVLGWAVTLRTARLDPATSARALEAIERNARAQSQLIEDLLDISRIVSGKLRLEVRIMDPITVVEAAIEAMRPAAASKDLALVATLDPRAGPVWGDPDRLQQVVWNLLSNAIKFTPKGGRVDVRLSQVDASVEIAVSDTGQGIAPALLPHVFERFRQADSSSTRTQGGLGIGLALVRHLVELHGGTVTAESPGVDPARNRRNAGHRDARRVAPGRDRLRHRDAARERLRLHPPPAEPAARRRWNRARRGGDRVRRGRGPHPCALGRIPDARAQAGGAGRAGRRRRRARAGGASGSRRPLTPGPVHAGRE